MLPKQNRLQKKSDFQKVFKFSKPIHTEHFSFRVQQNKGQRPTRLGFVVSNKVEKRATRRNALRRQLRKIAESLILEAKTGYDVVTVVKKDFPFPYQQEDIRREFEEGIKKSVIGR